MDKQSKKLSNPFSTGGGGGHFEAHIQSCFVALMLSGGYAPCLPCWPIKEIKLQGKVDGYETDDLVVFVENNPGGEVRRLLGQVKHSITFTPANQTLGEVLLAAWNDFNNSNVFSLGKDAIALITGPVSAIDQQNVQWLLHHAKHTKNSSEFYRDVQQANFSPAKAEDKLSVFRHHLRAANNGSEVNSEELYRFLNHFHILGYDLGGETGVVLSLLHSHISQFHKQYPQWVWSRIVDVVQTWNQHAGTVTRDRLPEDLLDAFIQKTTVSKMPEELKPSRSVVEVDWLHHEESAAIALISLLGAWDENKEHDVSMLCRMLNVDYSEWLPRARVILHLPDSPLKLKNGVWSVERKEEFLSVLGTQILDPNLDTFKEIAKIVLEEIDPAFDLPKDQRYAASVHGKVFKHSGVLRQGVSEGLAILGSRPEFFSNCSTSKPENIALFTIRELLEGSKWQEWASLNSLLPNLAEATPTEFIAQVEKALLTEPCPIEEVFAQEGDAFTGGNYHAGLLWALENLAWEEKYLVQVCCALAELASKDPGGKWSNRPFNSIVTILLPWHPQTLASIEKRKVAIKSILAEAPDIGWRVLLKLLPGQHQTSSGAHKPRWRKAIPEGWKDGVSKQDYWEQVRSYSELAVNVAGVDFDHVSELIEYFDHLPGPAFDAFITSLSSSDLKELSEEKKQIIWDRLIKFSHKHRKFSEAKWALPDDLLARIETVAEKFVPQDLFHRYQHLFSDRNMDLYEETGNWEEQREKLDKRRETAIAELLQVGSLDSIVRFASVVSFPRAVGSALGSISHSENDEYFLPEFLSPQKECFEEFIGAYLWRRRYLCGWEWADTLEKSTWTNEQLGQFLAYLPFEKNAWDRALDWLRGEEKEYWVMTPANAFQADAELGYAVEKLLRFGRPRAAINCLGAMLYKKLEIDSGQCIRALLEGVNSAEANHSLDQYHIVELIKLLQADPEVNESGLSQVEWAYLALLDHYNDAEPILLESKLASDPEFFCELIQLIFRSSNEDETQEVVSEDQSSIAEHAWELLHNWKTIPGMSSDGVFSPEMFEDWIQNVIEACSESGHLEVALIKIGEVLIHAPADSDGLWINRTVANALNAKESEEMRRGYSTGSYNARGAHWVDPTGAAEKELAEQFRQRAEAVENAGFFRLAQTLRSISDGYVREAKRVISEH